MMKRWLCVLLAFSLLASCSLMGTAQEVEGTRTFVDSAGRSVEVPEDIERIAPSGKMAHIVLYALAPEKFVCLSNSWTKDAAEFFPEAMLNLPVVGQFYGESTLNMEALAAVNPQIIIDIGESKKSIAEDMDGVQEQLGIPTVFIEASTETMGECYRKLGDLLGLPEQGEALAAYCESVYGKAVETMAQIGEEGKKKVLYCLSENGLNVIGQGSYHAEVLDLLGDNVAVIDSPSSKGTGDAIDMEQLLLWSPDVIFFSPEVDVEAVVKDEGWQMMDAIKSGQYYRVPAGPFNWMGFPPSVNRYIGMIWMGQVLYPEAFGYDLLAETQRYYELFYHYEMSQEKFEELTQGSLPVATEDAAA